YYKHRDLLIIKILLSTGIRVSELINIKKHNIHFADCVVDIQRKGGDYQSIPLSREITEDLQKYIHHRGIEEPEDFVFQSRLKQQLKANSVYILVSKYLRAAKIQKSKYGPHLLRHTAFTSMCRN